MSPAPVPAGLAPVTLLLSILLADIGEPAAVHQAAMRAVTALQVPLTLARRDARLSVSVGIALYPADGDVNKRSMTSAPAIPAWPICGGCHRASSRSTAAS